AGVAVVYASAVTGEGIDELRRMLAGRLAVLTGQSGVGKSSLLNRLIGVEAAAVGAVSGGDSPRPRTTPPPGPPPRRSGRAHLVGPRAGRRRRRHHRHPRHPVAGALAGGQTQPPLVLPGV